MFPVFMLSYAVAVCSFLLYGHEIERKKISIFPKISTVYLYLRILSSDLNTKSEIWIDKVSPPVTILYYNILCYTILSV